MPLPLLIAPQVALAKIIDPALEQLPRAMDSDRAALRLLVIALQESGLLRRQSLGHGPARGLWQFERGGCDAVMGHALCKPLLPGIGNQDAAWACYMRNWRLGASPSAGLFLRQRGEYRRVYADDPNQGGHHSQCNRMLNSAWAACGRHKKALSKRGLNR